MSRFTRPILTAAVIASLLVHPPYPHSLVMPTGPGNQTVPPRSSAASVAAPSSIYTQLGQYDYTSLYLRLQPQR
jgi:hypothetical protein